MTLFAELKRRNVFRVALAYALGSWLLLQAADVLFGVLRLPDWSLTLVAAILGLGFVPAVVIAWIYELTPEGLKRDTGHEQATQLQAQSGRKLDVAIVGLFVVTIGLLGLQQLQGPAVQGGSETDTGSASLSAVENKPDPISVTSDATDRASDDRITIAVLPFDNFGGNPDNAYFADGLADTILHKLAQSRELKVTARNSSFAYKGQSLDVRTIGEALGVTWLLEGSVQRQGDRLRVIAQLVETGDGSHAWSATYDRATDDLFALQDEIAADVATNLQVSLAGSDDLDELGTDNLVAFDLVQLAQARMDDPVVQQRMRDGLPIDDVRKLIEDALLQDPTYVGGWLALFELHESAAYFAPTPALIQQHIDAMAAALNRAQELARDNPFVQLDEGWLAWRIGGIDLDTVESAARNALAANPNMASGWSLLGLLQARRDPDQAHLHLRRAQELDPANPVVYRQLAITIDHRDVEAAMEFRREALRRRPGDLRFITDIAEAEQAYFGRHDRAVEITVEAMKELGEANELRDEMMDRLTDLGATLEAERWLERWAADAIDPQVHAPERIELALASEEYAEARQLAAAYVEGSRGTDGLFWTPLLLARVCLWQEDFECIRASILEVNPGQEDPDFDPATARSVWNAAWATAAMAYADQGLGDQAAADRRCGRVLRALETYPRWQKQTLDAICFMITDRHDEAIAALTELLTLSELSFGPVNLENWSLFEPVLETEAMREFLTESRRRQAVQRETAVALSQAYLEAHP